MDSELRTYLEGMEARLRDGFRERLDAAAHSTSVDIGHVHTEIQALHSRMTKMQANITTSLELLTRQSRWHDETDANAAALLTRVNELERRVNDLEQGKGGAR